MTEIVPFEFETHPVRTVTDDNGNPWFFAKDVCDILDLKNYSATISRLKDYEKNTLRITDGNRGNPTTNIISESGMYKLAFRSNKPKAEKFTHWVASER